MGKILVVDDSPTILKLVEGILQNENHEVFTVRDALSAMATLEKESVDLMLLDIMLEGVGGIELCSMIRRYPQHESMPIVMLTALQNQANLAYQFGADAYITKPFSEKELIEIVNQNLVVSMPDQDGAEGHSASVV